MKALPRMLVALCLAAAASAATPRGIDELKACPGPHEQADHDQAIRSYTKVIASGELRGAGLARAFFCRGNSWYFKRDFDRAIADYSEAIRLDPQSAEALTQRAFIWAEHKNDFERAIADFSASIRLNPRDAPLFAYRGAVWRRKKDFGRAIADYSEAIRLDPKDAFPLNRRGLTYLMLGNYGAAIADFDSAILLWPGDSHSLYGRGLARRMMGDRTGGDADMAAATQDYPAVVEIYVRDGFHGR